MTPMLETRRLSLALPGFVLNAIDLRVDTGSILALIGPSGAGKTTLMKLIMGQIQPDAGDLRVCGLAHPGDLKEIRQRIGYVAEDPPFEPRKRVREILGFAAPYYPGWDSARCAELLREFEIDPEQRIQDLSRGRKSLLSLAQALSHRADLLLLDEPASGLDALRRRRMLQLIVEFTADGEHAVVITTHQTDGLAPLADRLAVLHHGQLLLDGQTEELLAARKWLRYRDGALSAELEAALLCRECGTFGNRGLIANYPDFIDDLQAGRDAGDIQVGNASIDDILISLTGGK